MLRRQRLRPKLEPYKLQPIEAREETFDRRRLDPMIPQWFGIARQPQKARLPCRPRVRMNGCDLVLPAAPGSPTSCATAARPIPEAWPWLRKP